MKNSIKRTLSMLLALTMVLSLGLPAYAVDASAGETGLTERGDLTIEVPSVQPGEEIITDGDPKPAEEPVIPGDPVELPGMSGKITDLPVDGTITPAEDPIGAEDIVLPEREDLFAEKTFNYADGNGFTVDVYAPAGALPDGVEMKVVRLDDLTAVQTAVDNAANVNGSVQLAADISFWLEDEEIEPTAGSKLVVQMSAPEIVGVADPIVIHIPDGENAAPEIVEQLTNGDLEIAGTVSFAASDFSVYAIIGGETHDEARLLVKYKQADGTEVSYYVKKSDINVETIDGVEYDRFKQVVYDPGVGTVPEGKMFLGWCKQADYTASTVAMTIDDVRDDIKAILNSETGVKEGDSVTYYPIILNARFVTYLDELGASIRNDVIKFKDGDSVSYTIKQAYTPREQDSRFDGWAVAAYNATTKQYEATSTVYENNTQITITKESENLVLIASVPPGHWLIFRENGSGATYTQPQFILSEGTATEPTPPSRTGYTFAGWFEGEPAQTGGDPTGAQFTAWGQKLTQSKTLFAKWTVNATAEYTIVFWQQQVEGDKYDFVESVRLSGSTSEPNNPVTAMNTGTTDVRDDYARINNKNYQYTGFHLGEYPKNITIAPSGTTVVNVYYDRNEYTYTFYVPSNDNFTGSYTSAGGNSYYMSSGSSSNIRAVQTVTRRYQANITDIWDFRGSDNQTYPRTRSYYGSNYRSSWTPARTDVNQRVSHLETIEAADKNFYVVYTSRTLRNLYYYVEAAAGDTTGTFRTFNGVRYKLYYPLECDFNFIVYSIDFWALDGYSQVAIATENNTNVTNTIRNAGSDGVAWSDHPGWNSTLYFYYSRVKKPIVYRDGKCFDGRMNLIEDAENLGLLKTGDPIPFGDSLASHSNDFTPTRTGYVFEGWYLDDACNSKFDFADNSMPKGGLTLYAKWIQVQYRVFLHPCVDKAEEEATYPNPADQFSMGGQNPCFRLDYGDTITQPVPVRKEYEAVGWYMSYDPETEEYDNAWNFDLPGNDTNITTAYGKTEETELDTPYGTVKPGQEGVNADKTGYNGGDRFWITRKLDLYLKWRLKLTGAQGIQVYYDAVEGEGEGTGKFADDTTLMYDPVGYYTDSAIAVAQGASIANSEKEEFKYWVLQKWDATANNGEGAYVDTETTVLPGATFKISKLDAREEQIEGADPEHDIYWLTYKIHLRAEYGSIEAPTPTHITWYSNVYDAAGNLIPDVQNRLEVGATPTYTNEEGETKNYDSVAFDANKGVGFTREEVVINIGIEIPAPDTYKMDGYTFLGWGRVDTAEESAASGNSVPGLTKAAASVTDPKQLNETNLFLKWVPSRDGETGHYEAQKPNGTWTEVDQVAADENHPYHDLYAVWGGTFQVVYTGAATPLTSIETYPINSTTATFDLMKTHSVDETTSAVTAGGLAIHTGYLYGGYYMDLPVASTKDEPYNGSNWTFDVSCAGTVNGKQIRPVGGVTYYVKEVPGNLSDNFLENYLKSKIIRTYYKKTDGTFDKTATIYLVSMIDGAVAEEGSTDLAAYKETGFIINKDVDNRVKAETVKTLVITAKDAKDETKPQAKYTATGTNGLMTYLKVYDRPVRTADAVQDDLPENQYVQQYWITNDGWLVTGCAMRKYQNLDVSGSMVKETVADNWMEWIDPGTTPSAG